MCRTVASGSLSYGEGEVGQMFVGLTFLTLHPGKEVRVMKLFAITTVFSVFMMMGMPFAHKNAGLINEVNEFGPAVSGAATVYGGQFIADHVRGL